MLVLSRKKSERILIGDDIEIMVVRFTDTNVRIGISAPKSMRIMRSELVADGLKPHEAVATQTDTANDSPIATDGISISKAPITKPASAE